jgi:hypothetical protein
MPSDEFDFVGGGDSPAAAGGAGQDVSRQVARCVPKLRGSSKASQLKVLAGLLEQVPQDVASLGPGSARDALLEALSERPILHSKQKDVRMYAAACYAQLLRIYAPDTPWGDDKQLEVRCGVVWVGGWGGGRSSEQQRCCCCCAVHAVPPAWLRRPLQAVLTAAAHPHHSLCRYCTACSPCLSCCCGAWSRWRSTAHPPTSWPCLCCRPSARWVVGREGGRRSQQRFKVESQ